MKQKAVASTVILSLAFSISTAFADAGHSHHEQVSNQPVASQTPASSEVKKETPAVQGDLQKKAGKKKVNASKKKSDATSDKSDGHTDHQH